MRGKDKLPRKRTKGLLDRTRNPQLRQFKLYEDQWVWLKTVASNGCASEALRDLIDDVRAEDGL